MEYSFIKFEILDGGIGKLTLNREDVLNSFHAGMTKECCDVVRHCKESDQVRVLLITGAGRAFSAGQDLSVLDYKTSEAPDLGEMLKETYNPLVTAIRSLSKPVVAFVNGIAAGAGASVALACDIIVAAESASFIQAFCKVGLIPDSGGTFFLPRLVGEARAKALMLLGDKLSAQEAEKIGMIYKSVPDAECVEFVDSLTQKLAKSATAGLGLIKEALHASAGNTFLEQLETEAELQAQAGKTADHIEGVQAFVEKRKPVFKGQ